jgi:4-amino-4-deoxy-L-arabinose transferase-like glycosyltransferase
LRFWIAVFALLAIMGLAQVVSVRGESQTWDEAMHVAAGYTYLTSGDLRFNSEHPPLAKYLNALPLLFLHPRAPDTGKFIGSYEEIELGREFLYRNTVGADRLLFTARSVTIAETLLFGLALALWTRRWFGEAVALSALAMFAFDPNLVAHGRYVTNDLLVSALIFAACATWIEYLHDRRLPWAIAAGAAVGLALGTKFSAITLVPILLALTLVQAIRERRFGLRDVGALACVALVAYAAILVVYTPEARALIPGARLWDRSLQSVGGTIHDETLAGRMLVRVSAKLGLARNRLFEGLALVSWGTMTGRPTYLLGKISQVGFWNYFPVVFVVKSATGLLLGLAATLVARARRAKSPGTGKPPQAGKPGPTWLLIPALVYFACAMASNINIGVRHLLPIYAFLFVFLAASFARTRWLLIAVPALIAIESILVFPYYLTFFNLPSGGPSHGPRYLVDSNLDWGQDLKHLKAYMDREHVSGVCLSYFGSAPPEYYGIQDLGEPLQPMDCLAAVSATALVGMYTGDNYRWLRSREPIARVGNAIYIFELRKRGP